MFGFLSQIPSFLGNHIGNVGRAIGSHIGNVGHTVGRHMGNVGQGVIKQARKPLDMLKIGGGGDGDGMMLPSAKMPVPAPTSVLTPGINPGARMPDIRLPEQAQSPLSIATMRPGRVGQVDMMSPAQPTPDALGINMSRNMPAVAPEVSMPTQVPMRELPQVRVPQLPGRTGPPLEDSPYNRARYEYVTRNMNEQGEIPRSWKTIGQSTLAGIAKTYQQNPNAPWQAQLAGGAAGGIGAAINPAGGEEFVFDSMYAPGVEKDQQRAQETDQRESERIRREQDVLMGKARIDELNRRANRPPVGEATWGTYNTETGQPIWQRPQGQSPAAAPRRYVINGALVDDAGNEIYKGQPKEREMSLSDAMAEETAAEGTVEQIAQDSLAGRLDSLKQRLPAQYQAAINNPDDPYYTEAQQAWNKMQSDELNKIRREVSERRRSNAGMRRKGGSRPPSSPTGGTTAVSSAAVEGYAKEKGISYDEALKRFQAKGIQVRK